MEEMDTERLDGLYKLYAAECDRNKLSPTLKDFQIWGVEKGYWED